MLTKDNPLAAEWVIKTIRTSYLFEKCLFHTVGDVCILGRRYVLKTNILYNPAGIAEITDLNKM